MLECILVGLLVYFFAGAMMYGKALSNPNSKYGNLRDPQLVEGIRKARLELLLQQQKKLEEPMKKEETEEN